MLLMTKIKNKKKIYHRTEYNAWNFTRFFYAFVTSAHTSMSHYYVSFIALRFNCTLFIITLIFNEKVFFFRIQQHSCGFSGRAGRGSHLVNVWKLNKAMLASGSFVIMITFYEPFEKAHTHTIQYIYIHIHHIQISTNIYALPHSMFVLLLVRSFVCSFLSSKQSVRIEFRGCGTWSITKGNSLVKHLTMYYIKHTAFPLKRDTLFSTVLTSFSGAHSTHFSVQSFACLLLFSVMSLFIIEKFDLTSL